MKFLKRAALFLLDNVAAVLGWIYRLPRPMRASESLESIVVVKIDEIGDFVLSTGLLRALKETSKAKITLITRRGYAALIAEAGLVDEVIEIEMAKGWGARLKNFWRLRESLEERPPFSAAVALRADTDHPHTHLLALMIPAHFRIGFGNGIFPWKKKNPWIHFFDARIESRENSVHESDIDLLPLKFLNLPCPESAHLKLAPIEQPPSYPLPSRYVVVGVGASRREKIYPAEKLAEALQLVRTQMNLPMVITGLAAEFYPAHSDEIDARGRLNLSQLAQVIKGAALFIGMDSGPLHMASAFDVPTILLSGASPQLAAFDPHSPQRFGPKATCQKVILNENNRGTQLSFDGVEPSRVAEQILNFYAKEFQACQKSV